MQARGLDKAALTRLATLFVATAIPVVALFFVTGPMLADFSTYGFHDWDVATAYRYITVESLARGEGPWWHPWLCGGVPAWGYVEGASNLASPYLPLYLVFDVRTALRLEVVGQALLGMAGAWMLAAHFTKSAALRSLLVALFVLNGRWAFQAAVGHTWHLQYALMPWAFWCFERALAPGGLRWAAGSGIALALACFWGGIYPLPHTALLLSGYAALRALLDRKLVPLAALAIAGFVAVAVGAPKLFAVLDHMRDVPRLIESTEVIGISDLLAMLLAPDQRYGERVVPVPAYNWHEWGIYVGPGGLFVLAAGLVFAARDRRATGYAVLGALCLLLGFGAFHPLAPWALLHELPIFASQHVPSRYHYPMLLMLGVAFVAANAPVFEKLEKRFRYLDLALLVLVAAFAWDMARFSRTPFEQAFWMRAPETIPRVATFEHRTRSPVDYVKRDWAGPMLLAMFANTGVIRCYGVDANFKPAAVGADSKRYRGRAYVVAPRDEQSAVEARAEVVEWTPNRAVVEVHGAPPGSLVVYNMNYDPSWRADGARAQNLRGLVAAELAPGRTRVEFSYFPRTLAWTLPLSLLTLAACFVPKPLLDRIRRKLRRA